jgi:hypothetical protein
VPASYRSIRFDRTGLAHVLKAPHGEVGRYLSRLGGYVTREALTLTAARLERHTGVYASSFTTTTLLMGGELRTRITNVAPYATYIERGTRPHVIRPVRARMLRFTTKQGQVVFAREVHHPGTKPYRILTDALRVGVRKAR